MKSEKNQKILSKLAQEARDQAQARELVSPGTREAWDYIDQISAAWKFLKAGDVEAAIVKTAVCLELQQKRLLEKNLIVADGDLFKIAAELGIPNREEEDPLRKLFEENKASYTEQL